MTLICCERISLPRFTPGAATGNGDRLLSLSPPQHHIALLDASGVLASLEHSTAEDTVQSCDWRQGEKYFGHSNNTASDLQNDPAYTSQNPNEILSAELRAGLRYLGPYHIIWTPSKALLV